VLEDQPDDPVVEEMTSLIESLSEDEQIDLVALAWIGRDDYSAEDWPAVRGGGGTRLQRTHGPLSSRYPATG